MNVTDITRLAGPNRKRRRWGRGRASGHGRTCGRGDKGQRSRSGAKRRSLSEGGQMPTFRRMPKRGFSNAKFRTVFNVVNVGQLEDRFDNGAHVTAQALLTAGLIRNARDPLKVLGDGALSKRLWVDAAKFSAAAAEKIKAAGGEARVMGS